MPPDTVAMPPPAPPYFVLLAMATTASAAGAALAAANAFPASAQSRRSTPPHQNAMSSAVDRLVSRAGSPSTPDIGETTSTSQTLNSPR